MQSVVWCDYATSQSWPYPTHMYNFDVVYGNCNNNHCSYDTTLQWCHNERNGILNHQHLDCLLNRLFRCRSKKTSKLCVTGLCKGHPPVTSGFPSQRANDAENVNIWWAHHGTWWSFKIILILRNSLASRRGGCNFWMFNFQTHLSEWYFEHFSEIALKWVLQVYTADKSVSIQVKTWCYQAESRYLNQYQSRPATL